MKFPSKEQRSKIYEWSRNIVLFIVAVLSIVSFFNTRSNEVRLSRANYELSSIGHRPLLKLVGPPQITSILIDTLSVSFRDPLKRHAGDTLDPHLVDVYFRLVVSSTILIANVDESSIGKIKMLMTSDSMPDARKFLTGEEVPTNADFNGHKWPELENSDVVPGDTVQLTASTDIAHINCGRYVMHFLIVYKNELGHLFHTHSKVAFDFKPMMWRPEKETKVSQIEKAMYAFVEQGINDNSLLTAHEPVNSFQSYSEVDAVKANKHIQELISAFSEE